MSQVSGQLRGVPWGGTVTIGGQQFPADGTDQEKVARLERAMVSIARAIEALADDLTRLEREVRALR